jgi:hypothetical protein
LERVETLKRSLSSHSNGGGVKIKISKQNVTNLKMTPYEILAESVPTRSILQRDDTETREPSETDPLLEQPEPTPTLFGSFRIITVILVLTVITFLCSLVGIYKVYLPYRIKQAINNGPPPIFNSLTIVNLTNNTFHYELDLTIKVDDSPVKVYVHPQKMVLGMEGLNYLKLGMIGSQTWVNKGGFAWLDFPGLDMIPHISQLSVYSNSFLTFDFDFLSKYLNDIVNYGYNTTLFTLHSNPLISVLYGNILASLDKDFLLTNSLHQTINISDFNFILNNDIGFEDDNNDTVMGSVNYTNVFPFDLLQKLNISVDFSVDLNNGSLPCNFSNVVKLKLIDFNVGLLNNTLQFWVKTPNITLLMDYFGLFSDGIKTYVRIDGLKVHAYGWEWVNDLISDLKIDFWLDGAAGDLLGWMFKGKVGLLRCIGGCLKARWAC